MQPLSMSDIESPPRQGAVALVAGDNALRSSLRLLLTVSGIQVQDYRSARDYLAATADPHRCLIADCRLPDMPGRGLCLEVIKRAPRTSIIILTASPEEFEFVRAARPNVCVLSKPFDVERLVDAVTEALESGHQVHPGEETLTDPQPAVP